MKSLAGSIVAATSRRTKTGDTPVPYARRADTLALPWAADAGTEREMRAYEQHSTLFACVAELAEATGQAEWGLFRQSPSPDPEDRTPVASHAALDLWRQPNPFYSLALFVETLQQWRDLTGESFYVIASSGGLPMSLWPVRPDRMTPVPHPTKFISGFVYTDPDGQRVPFTVDEVVWDRYPNPLDPYRGLGPVQALLTHLDADQFTAEWNRSFFRNDASPGGLLTVEDSLSDPEFDELRDRWDAQHRGTGNAHRVAILERGMTWTDRQFSMRDMQFAELQEVSDTRIMLAFRMGKTLLGQTEGVNRATAYAAEYVFSKWRIVRRLERFKQALNSRILPMYVGGDRLEFDYVSPVQADVEIEAVDRDSRVAAAVALIGAGFDPDEVLEAFDLPALTFTKPAAPPPPPLPPGLLPELPEPEPGGAMRAVLAAVETDHHHHHGHRHRPLPALPRAADEPAPLDLPPDQLPDVQPLEDDFQEAMARLLARWESIEADQKQELAAQVLDIARTGTLEDLAALTVDTTAAREALRDTMGDVAERAARHLVAEAAAQGVELEPRVPGGGAPSTLAAAGAGPRMQTDATAGVAALVAEALAARLKTSAATAAMRANGPDTTPEQVAEAVAEHLRSLSPNSPKPMLTGALTGAQNDARIETLKHGPAGAVYAAEKNDTAVCSRCKAIDGKWLGNTDNLEPVYEQYPGGAYGGYVDCLGKERCRGTITGVWRQGAVPAPPAPAPEPEPGPSPFPADVPPPEPGPFPAEGDAPPAAALAALVAREGEATDRYNVSGAQGRTEIVTLPDGSKFVAKTIAGSEYTGEDPVEIVDREELAALVAGAAGVRAPAVHRVSGDKFYMEWVAGRTGGGLGEADTFGGGDVLAPWAGTDSGRLMGLMDVITSNGDRNVGNWIEMPDGAVAAIDHGYAFDDFSGGASPAEFAGHFIDRPTGFGADGPTVYLPNDMSAGDMSQIRLRLAALRPEFDRLGRGDWHDAMTGRFERVAAQAGGTRSRL